MGATGASHPDGNIERWQLAMGEQNFEALQWSAENHGRRQRLAKYAIAYGSRD